MRFGATANEARTLTRRARVLVPRGSELIFAIRRRPTRIGTQVVGLRYEGREQRALGVQPGAILELRRDFGNFYDPNAIAAMYHGNQIGFLGRAVARLIAPELDAGFGFEALVSGVSREPYLSIRIEISSGR